MIASLKFTSTDVKHSCVGLKKYKEFSLFCNKYFSVCRKYFCNENNLKNAPSLPLNFPYAPHGDVNCWKIDQVMDFFQQ